jgi:hypothetical protein
VNLFSFHANRIFITLNIHICFHFDYINVMLWNYKPKMTLLHNIFSMVPITMYFRRQHVQHWEIYEHLLPAMWGYTSYNASFSHFRILKCSYILNKFIVN